MRFLSTRLLLGGCILGAVACSKYNPNHLPSVSPSQFGDKIEGFDSSGEVAAANLVAYWSFDGNEAESISGVTPTSTSNDSYITKGVRGQGLALNSGYLYYATQIPNLGTSLHSFTILAWVQVLNNGSTPTSVFQLARPGNLFGNINFILETGQNPASDLNDLIVHPDYFDGNGTQDNLNANWAPDGAGTYYSPTIGANVWTQIGVTFDSASVILQVWANGKRIGTLSYQQRGTALYKPTVPDEVIIGGWYNDIPGKAVTTDTWTVPMVGGIDEIRVYNTALGTADIKALYELGAAGK
jgi:hypothetical protein